MDEPNVSRPMHAVDVPKPPQALEVLEEGLNRLDAEIDRLHHRLGGVLVQDDHDKAPSEGAYATNAHALAYRVHDLVNTLQRIIDRVAI